MHYRNWHRSVYVSRWKSKIHGEHDGQAFKEIRGLVHRESRGKALKLTRY
jgi:hypothetical protein